MGIEPTSSAWKAEVLPLNYARQRIFKQPPTKRFYSKGFLYRLKAGGGGRIRTSEGRAVRFTV